MREMGKMGKIPVGSDSNGSSPDTPYRIINEEPSSSVLTVKSAAMAIFKSAAPIAFSLTFSFMVALLLELAKHFSSQEEEQKTNAAAATLVSNFLNFCAILGTSFLLSVGASVSEAWGKNKESEGDQVKSAVQKEIEAVFKSGLIWTIASSLAVSLLCYYSADLFKALQQPEEVADRAQEFLRPYAPAIPFLFTRILFEQMIIAFSQNKEDSRNKRMMIIALAGFFVIGLPLGAGLAFGKEQHFKGLALGFAAQEGLTSLLFGLILFFHRRYRSFSFWGLPSFESMGRFMRQGVSFMLPAFSEQASSLALALLVGFLGKEALAAQTTVFQSMLVAIIFQIAISVQGNAVFMAEAMGEKNAPAAKTYAQATVLTNGVTNAVIAGGVATVLACTSQVAYPGLLLLGPALQCVEALFYTMSRAMGVKGKILKPTALSLASRVLGLGLGAALGLLTEAGTYGVNGGYFLGLSVGLALLTIYWQNRTSEESFKNSFNAEDSGHLLSPPSSPFSPSSA